MQSRHKRAVPFSSLTAEDDNGEEIHFEAEDKNTGISETAIEIYSLKAELELFGISFFELPKAAPKSKKNTQCLLTDRAVYCKRKRAALFCIRQKIFAGKTDTFTFEGEQKDTGAS